MRKDNSFSNRFKWYAFIDKLAGSDITKYDEIYKQNFISCLNHLSYHKELSRIMNARNK